MFNNLKELKDFEDSCLTEIINKNGNELTQDEIEQIKAVYTSNELTKYWWQFEKMTKPNYTFSLFKIGDTIVGVSGMDHDDYEIRDDAVHNDFQNRGIYKRLMKHTNDWLKRNRDNIPYYLFTEKTRDTDEDKKKILNHINSGLVLLDRSTGGSDTYESGVNGQTYERLGGKDYLVFRTPGNHDINFVTYNARSGSCSGIYIGNGIILTADHCDRLEQEDYLLSNLKVTELRFPFRQNQKSFRIQKNFIRYPGRNTTDENFTNDFAIIRLEENEANIFNHDMEVIPLLLDNLTIHGKSENEGGNYPSNSSKRYYYAYGINDRKIRKTKINEFHNTDISKHYGQNNIPPNLKGETFIDTLDNYRKKFNCVKIETGKDFDEGDSGGPHFHIKNETGQIVYLGPTGTKNYTYCLYGQDVVISAVYQHRDFIKANHPSDLLIYNLERDTFLFE